MMMAKIAGFSGGAVVFVLWFYLIGARPVLETIVGLALAGGFGLWAYAAVNKWQRRRQNDAP